MTSTPNIITGGTPSTLPSIATKSVNAVLGMVPVNAVAQPGRSGAPRPIDQHMVDTIAFDLIRISAGPVALLVIHGSDTWAEVMQSLDMHVTQSTYDDAMDLVIASRNPVTPPPQGTGLLQDLVDALMHLISATGDDVLIPWATNPVLPLLVQAAGRQVHAITDSSIQSRRLGNAFDADGSGISLTKEEHTHALAEMASGKRLARVARNMGIAPDALRKAIERRKLKSEALTN